LRSKKSKSKLIAEKNDECRRTFLNCRIILTASVVHSPNREKIIQAIQNFKYFKKEDDPYGEHDFGTVDIEGNKYFFKIDYYDEHYWLHREDGKRVITIMRSDEY